MLYLLDDKFTPENIDLFYLIYLIDISFVPSFLKDVLFLYYFKEKEIRVIRERSRAFLASLSGLYLIGLGDSR